MVPHCNEADIEQEIARIRQSRKYRNLDLCEETLRDLMEQERRRFRRLEDAIQSARQKLHHVVAPYLGDLDYQAAREELDAAFLSSTPEAIRACCARLLEAHLSTRERLPLLQTFYSRLFEATGKPATILDLACGLNPFAFPWMGLPTSVRYYAYDLHRRRVTLINHYFSLQGLLPLAQARDVLVHVPPEEADVAFLFKEIHRFEDRRRGCSLPLLEALRVRHLLVSLPTRNLTGRRDLAARHRRLFYDIVQRQEWKVTEIEFENELVFCVEKPTG